MTKILTIGPDYKTLKGGIASVLEVYAKCDKSFKFLPTYSSENNIINLLIFPLKYFNILFFLFTHPSYKIVHIHGASRISFYRKYGLFISLKYILRRKIVYHIHGGEYHLFEDESNLVIKKIIHHMIDESDAVICLSPKWKEFFVTKFNSHKVFVLNNIIPVPLMKNTNNKYSLIHFLFLGTITEGKGIFDLLKIVSEQRAYFTNKMKISIGGNGETERLLHIIKKSRLTDMVEFVGWVSGEKKEKLLSASDVYVLPSYNEGLPISILEAMSYKKPIISTNVGGIPTIVQNDVNGKLIEPRDEQALFESLKYFIEYPELIPIYGEKSFEMVQDFLPESVISDLHKIYREIENES